MSDQPTKSPAAGRPRITTSDARTAYAMERFPENISTARSHLRVIKAAVSGNDDATYFSAEASAALDAAEKAFLALVETLKTKA